MRRCLGHFDGKFRRLACTTSFRPVLLKFFTRGQALLPILCLSLCDRGVRHRIIHRHRQLSDVHFLSLIENVRSSCPRKVRDELPCILLMLPSHWEGYRWLLTYLVLSNYVLQHFLGVLELQPGPKERLLSKVILVRLFLMEPFHTMKASDMPARRVALLSFDQILNMTSSLCSKRLPTSLLM